MTISPPGLVNIACSVVFLLFPLDDMLEMDYHDKNSRTFLFDCALHMWNF